MIRRDSDGRGPRDRVWSAELREAFLALLRETGNARAAARRLGHRHLFNNRMRRDPDFRRECRAAAEAADRRLRGWPTRFPPPIEVKSMPPGGEPPDRPDPREPMIRRTSNGRYQITYVHEGEMGSADEAEFLALLRSTGQFVASALAVGFSPTTVYRRIHRSPDFARRCEKARDEADVTLEYRLVDHCHALLRRPGEARLEGEADVPFDPEAAMRILHFLDRRRAGRLGSKPRKGPPERTFEEAVESILAKVEAIKRHRELMAERAREEEESPLPERVSDPPAGRCGVGRRAQRDLPESELRPPPADPSLAPPFQGEES